MRMMRDEAFLTMYLVRKVAGYAESTIDVNSQSIKTKDFTVSKYKSLDQKNRTLVFEEVRRRQVFD